MSRRRRGCSPSCRNLPAACSSPGPRTRARCSPTSSSADVVVLYRTVPLSPEPPDGDVVVLASASAARAFGSLGAPIPVVSIGPQTSAAARAAGLDVIAEAASHDLDGLVAAVATLAL